MLGLGFAGSGSALPAGSGSTGASSPHAVRVSHAGHSPVSPPPWSQAGRSRARARAIPAQSTIGKYGAAPYAQDCASVQDGPQDRNVRRWGMPLVAILDLLLSLSYLALTIW